MQFDSVSPRFLPLLGFADCVGGSLCMSLGGLCSICGGFGLGQKAKRPPEGGLKCKPMVLHLEGLGERYPLRHCCTMLSAKMPVGFHRQCPAIRMPKPSGDGRNVHAGLYASSRAKVSQVVMGELRHSGTLGLLLKYFACFSGANFFALFLHCASTIFSSRSDRSPGQLLSRARTQ